MRKSLEPWRSSHLDVLIGGNRGVIFSALNKTNFLSFIKWLMAVLMAFERSLLGAFSQSPLIDIVYLYKGQLLCKKRSVSFINRRWTVTV